VVRSILLTGRPGVGKSTLLEGILHTLPSFVRVTGILSGELRVEGQRQGFTVRAISRDPGILASPDLPGEPRFGTLLPNGKRRLGISLTHLETDVCPSVEASLGAADIALLDEIGAMQAESTRFRTLIQKILALGIPLVATVGLEPHWWLDQLREDHQLSLLELTTRNRDIVREMLAAYILAEHSK